MGTVSKQKCEVDKLYMTNLSFFLNLGSLCVTNHYEKVYEVNETLSERGIRIVLHSKRFWKLFTLDKESLLTSDYVCSVSSIFHEEFIVYHQPHVVHTSSSSVYLIQMTDPDTIFIFRDLPPQTKTLSDKIYNNMFKK